MGAEAPAGVVGRPALARRYLEPPFAGLGATVAVARHWLAISVRDRKFAITATLIPLNYLILFLITVINGNQAPTVLVMADRGPYAQAFVRALRSTDTFNLQPMAAAPARHAFTHGKVVAMITIPASFDRDMRRSQAGQASLQVDNIESDFVDDIQRGMDLAMNRFAASNLRHRVALGEREVDEHRHEVPYVAYVMVSIAVIALMIGGLFYGGVNTAREYEQRSVIDMILAPRSRLALLLGMAAGTFLVAAPGGLLVLAIVSIGFGIDAASWPELALAWALVLTLYSAGGVLLGTALRQRNGLSGLAILLSIPMLSLSGAFYPVSWSSSVIRTIAHAFPNYYANALFEHAFYAVRTTPTSLAADYAIVVLFIVAVVGCAGLLMAHREEPA
jgi:ABC-type multidrug transport system permease subunit